MSGEQVWMRYGTLLLNMHNSEVKHRKWMTSNVQILCYTPYICTGCKVLWQLHNIWCLLVYRKTVYYVQSIVRKSEVKPLVCPRTPSQYGKWVHIRYQQWVLGWGNISKGTIHPWGIEYMLQRWTIWIINPVTVLTQDTSHKGQPATFVSKQVMWPSHGQSVG